MHPLVSIIIPHFSRPALLALAVESIRRGTFRDFEIIVVDDGSAEDDWRLLNAMQSPDLRVFRREDGIKGPSRCRNIGLAMAHGPYVMFLDSDDLMAPWCLEERLGGAVVRPDADLWVFPVLLFRDRPGDMDVLWNAMADGRCDRERFARSDPPWHTSSPIWRTASLKELGGFNEAVFYGDDSELHLRALVVGLRCLQYPDCHPDIFIRRSDAPRITNSLSPFLVESRRTRLREGTRFLKSTPDGARLMSIWEGQYFVEAEFLLFNHETPRQAVCHILHDWREKCSPPRRRQWVVACYFAVALAARKSAYLALRLARRLAMILLPPTYFPSGGAFHHARAGKSVMALLTQLPG